MFAVNVMPCFTGDVGHPQCTDLLIVNVLLRSVIRCVQCWSEVVSYWCKCSSRQSAQW